MEPVLIEPKFVVPLQTILKIKRYIGRSKKALRTCINPLFLMLPAVVCCSYAFMLPVSTPPNALVYGVAGGDMKISDMKFFLIFLKLIIFNDGIKNNKSLFS
ncbi:hypothetical protein Avbf_06273 [Armadillidium vulgare]|nr:hypothetical protein Avbf_06273 [Armadillidium vulgare]